MDDLKVARGLGWASFAIAGVEAFAPHLVEEELGIDDHSTLLKGLAVREAAAGATLLSQNAVTPTLAAGLWSRVAGDAMDLALLGMAAAKSRNPSGVGTVSILVAGITMLDLWCAVRVQRRLTQRAAIVSADPLRGKKKARLAEQGVTGPALGTR